MNEQRIRDRAPDPEVLAALPDLEREGLVREPAAGTIRRLASGELVSLRPELRSALYLGVLLLVSGISLFVKENAERIGPLAIAIAGAVIVAALFVWIARRAEPFSWQAATSRHLGFDFLLLLAALLAAADLAFIESRFTPLGPDWSWHLLFVALGYAALAVRYDSKLLFSLALTTFAAWRGVAVGFGGTAGSLGWLDERSAAVRWNALICGALFVLLGAWLARSDRKAHFEPTAVVLGWILVLGAMLSGRMDFLGTNAGAGAAWALAACVTGLGLAAGAVRARRFGLFSLGVGAAYLGFLGVVLPILDDAFVGCFGVFGSSTAVIVAIVVAHQRWFREVPAAVAVPSPDLAPAPAPGPAAATDAKEGT